MSTPFRYDTIVAGFVVRKRLDSVEEAGFGDFLDGYYIMFFQEFHRNFREGSY